jgi:hypothetical protein
MVESKLVELVVAGSNPVGHPIPITPGAAASDTGIIVLPLLNGNGILKWYE